MKQGILLVAAGHPYYGKMAAALAATIRLVDKEVNIHIAYCGEALCNLTVNEIALFTSQSVIPESYYQTKKGNEYIRIKLFLNRLSPFEKTIFLDSDLLWLKKKPSELFDSLSGFPMSYQNYGFVDLQSESIPDNFTIWANVNEVKKAYELTTKFYQVHSEMMYFEKSKVANKYFNTALKIYDNLKVKSLVFAGGIPDELPFAIASSLLEIYPHIDNFVVAYWARAQASKKHVYQLYDDYFALSMAGSNASHQQIADYNILASAAYHHLGLQHPHKWKNKKNFLKERKSL